MPVSVRFCAPAFCGRFIAGGDARGHARQDAIGEAGLGVGLEHHGRQAAQHRGQHHRARRHIRRPRSAAQNSMPAQDREANPTSPGTSFATLRAKRIPPCLSGPPSESSPAATRPRAPGALPFRVACPRTPLPFPLLAPSHSRATASAGKTWPPVPPPAIKNFKFWLRRCSGACTPQFACWLIFRSTPVASSITNKLDPP